MSYLIFPKSAGSYRTAIALTSALAIFISVYITFCNLMEFDGAFNTQAAINLYREGALTLDYKQTSKLQTLLPFQVINGFFFAVFGNTFLVTNFANVLFYFVLYGLFVFLAFAYSSLLPFLAFIAMSLNHSFLVFGFGGYGEVPALAYGIMGAVLLVFSKNFPLSYFLSGILIAFAVTTKWVLFFIVPPVFLALFLLRPERKNFFCFFGSSLFAFFLVNCFQYPFLEPDNVRDLLQSFVRQSTPQCGDPYFPQKADSLNNYWLHLKEIWTEYQDASFGVFALLKIGLSFLIFFAAAGVLFKRRNRLERTDIFFIFLASFLFIYLAWAFTLNSRWYMRRMLNADILIYLSVGLLPGRVRLAKEMRFAVFCVLSLFCFFYALLFFESVKHFRSYSLISHEHRMREGLRMLPPGYNGYGLGVLEAPHWSFLAGKKFKDILQDSIFYDCIEGDCHNYLFLDGEMVGHPLQANLVLETFELKKIFMLSDFRISRTGGHIGLSDFRISRIKGFKSQGKSYVEMIDFSEPQADRSITRLHDENRDRMYSPPRFEFNEMAVFLDNRRGFPLVKLEFTAHECHDGKNLRVALFNHKKKYIQNFTVNRGENRLLIKLPEGLRGDKMDVYLLLEKALRTKRHQCLAQNENCIPLEYKKIELFSGGR